MSPFNLFGLFGKKSGKKNRKPRSSGPRRDTRYYHPRGGEQLEERTMLSVSLSGAALWTGVGPFPITFAANVDLNGSGNGAPNFSEVADIQQGSINQAVVDPNNLNHVFVATVNGGVWQTTNANAVNPSWSTKTDALPSLAISAIAIDPTNSNNVYAGTGSYSSIFGGVSSVGDGGSAVGIYRSTDGGLSWSVSGRTTFAGMRIVRIVTTTLNGGQTVFAATTDVNGANTGGIYRSDIGGAPNVNGTDSWVRISGANGLPDAGVTDIVADPGNANRFYAAVVGATGAGIYRSTDGGANWSSISNNIPAGSITNAIRIRLSVSPAGQNPIYAGLIGSNGKVSGIFRSVQGTDGIDNNAANGIDEPAEATWVRVGVAGAPNIYPFSTGQGGTHFSLLASSTSDTIVYAGGQSQLNFPFTGNIMRGDSVANTWTPVAPGPTSLSSPHADSRGMIWDGTTIIEVDDGGIYRLTNPDTAASTWASMIGTGSTAIQNTELYSVAIDTNGVISGGAQDNGAFQLMPDGTWAEARGGDGILVRSVGTKRYFTTQNFDFTSQTGTAVNKSGDVFPNFNITGAPAGTFLDGNFDVRLDGNKAGSIFSVAYGVNPTDNNRLLVGTRARLYRTANGGNTWTSIGGLVNGTADGIDNDHDTVIDNAGEVIPGTVTNVTGTIVYVAYGATANSNAAYVANATGGVFFSSDVTVAGGGFSNTGFAGGPVLQIVIDPNNASIAYAVTATGAWSYNGTTWTDLTSDIARLAVPGSGGVNLRSITLFNNGTATTADDWLLVGGYGGVFRRAVTPPGGAPFTWSEYGDKLPGVIVDDVVYDPTNNVVIAGTVGRGVWEVTNASATIASTVNLTVAGDGGPNAMSLIVDPNNTSRILVSDGINPTQGFDIGLLNSIQFNGLGGNDTLTVDFTNGNPIAVSGVNYNGGTGTSDALILQGKLNGGKWATERETPTGAHAGSVVFTDPTVSGGAAQTITYQNLAPIIDTVAVVSFTKDDLAATADTINLIAKTIVGNAAVTSEINSSSNLFELIDFGNKDNVTINGLDLVDTIHVGSGTGNLQFVNYGLTANGGGQVGDSLIVDDSGEASTRDFPITGTNVGANAPTVVFTLFNQLTGLNYAGFSGLTVNTGTATDIVNIVSTSIDTTLFDAGAKDSVFVGSGTMNYVTQSLTNASLDTIAAKVHIIGKTGAANNIFVFLDDSSNSAAYNYDVTPAGVSNSSVPTLVARTFAGVTIDGAADGTGSTVSQLTLTGTTGANQFNVTPSVATQFFINGLNPTFAGPGADKLVVNFAGLTGKKLTYSGPPLGNGNWAFSNRKTVNFTSIEMVNYFPILVIGSDTGTKGSQPWVQVVDADTGEIQGSFLAYESTYQYGVRVAQGDLNGDGIPEIVTTPGRLKSPLVKIFSVPGLNGSATGSLLTSFLDTTGSYATRQDGFSVAVGDVDGNGSRDIILSPLRGITEVHVWANNAANGAALSPANFAAQTPIFPFPSSFIGGAVVSTGDFSGDGIADILIGSGSGTRATVRTFNFVTKTFLADKTPFSAAFRGGISSLFAADVDGDGKLDLVVGSGQGGQGQLAYFSTKAGNTWINTVVHTDQGFNSQTYVAGAFVTTDGVVEIFTGQGQDGRGRKIRRWKVNGVSPVGTDFLTPDSTKFGGFFLG